MTPDYLRYFYHETVPDQVGLGVRNKMGVASYAFQLHQICIFFNESLDYGINESRTLLRLPKKEPKHF